MADSVWGLLSLLLILPSVPSDIVGGDIVDDIRRLEALGSRLMARRQFAQAVEVHKRLVWAGMQTGARPEHSVYMAALAQSLIAAGDFDDARGVIAEVLRRRFVSKHRF